jgi:hypothetical protein
MEKSEAWWHTRHPNDGRKCKIGGCGPGQPGQNARPYLKNNKNKRARGLAQTVEYLPLKHKSVKSNLVPPTWLVVKIADENKTKSTGMSLIINMQDAKRNIYFKKD